MDKEMSTAATKAGESFACDMQMDDQLFGHTSPATRSAMAGYERCWEEEVEPRDATIAELRAEVEEQARLLGAGGSREAALMAEVDRWKKVAQVACDALADPHKMSLAAEAISKLAENGITPSK